MNLADMATPWTQHLRLALLRALSSGDECPGAKGHESLLTDLVNAVHIAAERPQVRDQLLWLHKEGLVAADIVSGAVVATLLPGGRDVAEGRRVHSGVKQPNLADSLKSLTTLQAALLKPLRPAD